MDARELLRQTPIIPLVMVIGGAQVASGLIEPPAIQAAQPDTRIVWDDPNWQTRQRNTVRMPGDSRPAEITPAAIPDRQTETFEEYGIGLFYPERKDEIRALPEENKFAFIAPGEQGKVDALVWIYNLSRKPFDSTAYQQLVENYLNNLSTSVWKMNLNGQETDISPERRNLQASFFFILPESYAVPSGITDNPSLEAATKVYTNPDSGIATAGTFVRATQSSSGTQASFGTEIFNTFYSLRQYEAVLPEITEAFCNSTALAVQYAMERRSYQEYVSDANNMGFPTSRGFLAAFIMPESFFEYAKQTQLIIQ